MCDQFSFPFEVKRGAGADSATCDLHDQSVTQFALHADSWGEAAAAAAIAVFEETKMKGVSCDKPKAIEYMLVRLDEYKVQQQST